MSDQHLLSGNEAIAQGAWEAGALLGLGYPGTPSTETLEYFAKLDGVRAEWAPNEKVALETAVGFSAVGGRSLVTMKHVGVNVAADPLMTLACTGVNGGLVLLAADDPGMYSSQNEQNSQHYAAFARVPMLEPTDSQEALDLAKAAFDLSEAFDTPVMLRSSVRISHTKTLVSTGERCVAERTPYEKDVSKWVMMPAFAKGRRKEVDKREDELIEYAESCIHNVEELRDPSVGVICCGAVYRHVRDALPQASIFKLGLSWPLPPKALQAFADKVDRVYVVEEASDYLSVHVRALGIQLAQTPRPLPRDGELTPGLIALAFGADEPAHVSLPEGLPPRPPALCPGCPHRIVFTELRRKKARVCGDIGCYTLGTLAPLSSMDICIDMGASISMAHGMELMREIEGPSQDGFDQPIVAVIGDSTFSHSGITSLLTTAYNGGTGTVCILDNRTTAMTGQQGNPANGITLQKRPGHELDLEALCKAVGADTVVCVDSQDSGAVREALADSFSRPDLTVIICKSPCVLLTKLHDAPYRIDPTLCRACGLCVQLGCPSLGKDPDTSNAFIDMQACVGCGQCVQYCSFEAISQEQGGKR